jgi:addiction module HigA family antidote
MSSKISATDNNLTAPIHPGQYVRDTILTPKRLSVSAAAKLVGVGRPALSNFLNGNVTTSSEMASRIEAAFSVPAQTLMDLQVAYDAAKTKAKGIPANVIPYVAPFLGIKATDIETWVERNIPARTRLSVLLRTLVNSTGNSITRVDFPGNDDAERPGWDGYIESNQATPWIPIGLSGWEFGTNLDIKGKADGDFDKSVKATAKTDRDKTTFVFVTPRHWPRKSEWIKEKNAKNQWKDVRAYDSSDLEQWLEQSIAAQAWFANETHRASNGVRSLDKCWEDWANVTQPQLVGSLFTPAINSATRTVLSRLTKKPNEPTIIAADSIEEALAFLAQLFGPAGGEELARHRDRVLVFDEPGVLPRLAQGTKDFIAVAANREVERELGPLAYLMHTIVIYPRNSTNSDPHVVLEPLNYEAMRSSLEDMGCGPDDVKKWINESGRSLTVLRRRLAKVPAVRNPEWAADHEVASSLVPYLFVGTWNSSNTADQTVLTLFANEKPYDKLEKECQRLASLNDSPLWSVGTFRGVVSKIDLLFAIASSITAQDLQHFFDIAQIVLGEDDPKLDLPEDERWAASLYGKTREFSAALREGISETLVLLAVHGNHLFRAHLGFDSEIEAERVVRELLTPLKSRILEANDHDLAAYAEATPHEFLTILEEDLKTDHPETYSLMRPAGSGIFGAGCARSGILWALEGLAWNPDTLPRTALVLAQLAEIEIKDNWANKPIHSLESIFRIWMPQTAADHATRLLVMKLLEDRFPKVAWKICIEQLNTSHNTGDYSHKPRWRNDAHGYGEPFKTWEPIISFKKEIINMVLNWNGSYTREMLCDLIQHLHGLSGEHQARVWELIKLWADGSASDKDKAFVREKIRVSIMSRRSAKRFNKTDFAILTATAKASYQALEPSDLLNKHEWLFRENWVEESADELYEELYDHEIDYRKREERIIKLRTEALREILTARGLLGVIDLAEMGNVAPQIGWLMAQDLLPDNDIPGFILASLLPMPSSQSWAKKNLIAGALRALQDKKKCVDILKKLKKELSQTDFVRLLLLAPFRRSTWQMVDKLDEQERNTYWSEVTPGWILDVDDENNEAVERLLTAQRPRAAFTCIHFNLESIDPELLFRLMTDMAKDGKDQAGQYQLDPYYIEKAFVRMDKSPVLTLEEKAGLELAYIEVLSKPWSRHEGYGIPNLEKYVEAHPEFYVQAIVWTYKRRSEGEDPPEWRVDSKHAQQLAERGHKLLEGINKIPGNDNLGELNANKLAAWIKTVRDACAELDRKDIADICLGKLLSGAPQGKDGIWPCEPVRQVIEDVHSKKIMAGAHTGLFNSRGTIIRGEGGDQERELAKKYRAWENALRYSHPFLASELLMDMVKTYELEADREDTEAGIKKRLR